MKPDWSYSLSILTHPSLVLLYLRIFLQAYLEMRYRNQPRKWEDQVFPDFRRYML